MKKGLMMRGAVTVAITVSMLLLAVTISSRGISSQAEPGHRVPTPNTLRPKWPAGIRKHGGPEFFASAIGSSSGRGTLEDPWDLPTALRQPSLVVPGSVIWLRGGHYGNGKTYFTSNLTGSPELPIVLRQWPGEQAVIDGSLVVKGAYTWFWGFEVTSSQTDRTGDQFNPAAGTLDGVQAFGPFTRFINMVVHDTREGFGLWTPAEGAEVTGCIIYNNGWQGPDRGHGHGIYAQNRDATKLIRDNIIFNQFGIGIHGYGSAKAFVRNFDVERNIVFNNGVLARDGRTDNIFFGSGGSLAGIRLEENHTYHSPAANIGTSRLGWNFGGQNEDVTVLNNYFIGGYLSLELRNWAQVKFRGNTIYSASAAGVYLQTRDSKSYEWDGNHYFGLGRFFLSGQSMNWAAWRGATGFESGSQFSAGAPSGVWVFLNRNRYEPHRGHLVVYNWNHQSTVDVDLSSFVADGASFEIRDVQNYHSAPVVSGRYTGRTVALAMTNVAVEQPLGHVPNSPGHTAPEFAVFVVIAK